MKKRTWWVLFAVGVLLIALGVYKMIQDGEEFDFMFWAGALGWMLAGHFTRLAYERKKKLEKAREHLISLTRQAASIEARLASIGLPATRKPNDN